MDTEQIIDANSNNSLAEIENENVQETENDQNRQILSKRQLKILAKKKRWLESKTERRAKDKEKRKLKIKRAKEMGLDLGPSRKMLKSLKMVDSACKLKICLDLSLADLMTPVEFSKTFKQLHRCYSINRRASAPLQLHIVGYSDKTKDAMSKMSGCFNWDINFHRETYSELFNLSDIIYLTSDSPNVLETLDHNKVYIIGALVDHNRLKNICYEKAVKDDISHARLPLDTYFKFKTRTVLTIDQVYLIILRVTEGKTWIESVMDVVPKRKGIELKGDLQDEATDNEDETSVSGEMPNEQSDILRSPSNSTDTES